MKLKSNQIRMHDVESENALLRQLVLESQQQTNALQHRLGQFNQMLRTLADMADKKNLQLRVDVDSSQFGDTNDPSSLEVSTSLQGGGSSTPLQLSLTGTDGQEGQWQDIGPRLTK